MFSSPARRCMHAASRQHRLNLRTSARSTPSLRQFQTSSFLRKDDAFDPSKTRPEEQKEGAKEEAKAANLGDAADPAGEHANKQNDPQAGGAAGSKAEKGSGSQERGGQSGGGSPKKNTTN